MNTQRRLWTLYMLTFLAGTAVAQAQEVRAIKLEWKTAADIGIAEPKISSLVHKPASGTVAQLKDITYIETAPLFSKDGNRTTINQRANTALPYAETLVRDASRLAFSPDIPMLKGERSERTRIIYIYNPGRSAEGPPARLLELSLPFKPEGVKQRFVWVDVALDRKGKVVNATAEVGTKPELAELVVTSVKTWRFSEPWKTNENNQAVLRLPVLLSNRGKSPASETEKTDRKTPRAGHPSRYDGNPFWLRPV